MGKGKDNKLSCGRWTGRVGGSSRQGFGRRWGGVAGRWGDAADRRVRRPVRGFSLVEILVVVAILALLLALILPALGSARESARQAMCASNLRQVGEANSSYMTDNRGWSAISVGYPNSTNQLSTPSGSSSELVLYGRLYEQYLNKDGRVYYCPSAQDWLPNGPYGLGNMGSAQASAAGSYFQRGVYQDALLSNKGLVHDPAYTSNPSKYIRDRKIRRAMMADLRLYRGSTGFGAAPSPPHHANLLPVLYTDLAVNPQIVDEAFSIMGADGIYGGDWPGKPGAWTILDELGGSR